MGLKIAYILASAALLLCVAVVIIESESWWGVACLLWWITTLALKVLMDTRAKQEAREAQLETPSRYRSNW
jgi:hypothetical protein